MLTKDQALKCVEALYQSTRFAPLTALDHEQCCKVGQELVNHIEVITNRLKDLEDLDQESAEISHQNEQLKYEIESLKSWYASELANKEYKQNMKEIQHTP